MSLKDILNVPSFAGGSQSQSTAQELNGSISFTWEIEDVAEIKKLDLWDVIHCKFAINKYSWILNVTSDGRCLYVVPKLLEPKNVVVKFSLKTLSILDSKNNIIHSAVSSGKMGYSGDPELEKAGIQKWELLKFGDLHLDYFTPLIFDGNLKLFVEMTILEEKIKE